jgi:phenylpropionate dioxygenase-like ring-hydroxylating dioxygenase large terminal subunit
MSWTDMTAELHEDQTHPQSWYAVALASEVEPGKPIGKDFLNTRVAVYRRASGEPVVLTSRCPHMGADLSLGDVLGDDLRCPYHHFRFGPGGECSAIPTGEPIPSSARVFSYPAVESFGLIWAFNGEEPLFEPPRIRGFDESDLYLSSRVTQVFTVQPWINVANTVDFMHLRYVHGLSYDFDMDEIRWVDAFHMEYEIDFDSPVAGLIQQQIRVCGPNTSTHVTVGKDTTAGIFTSTPVGSVAQSYYVAAVPRLQDSSLETLQAQVAEQEAFGDDLLADDHRTLTGIRFQVGSFVKEDRAFAKFLRWVHDLPTARFD